MRVTAALLVILISSAVSAQAAGTPHGSFDWDRWRDLPVQNGGRHKPLDTVAWEMLRLIANRTSFTDPETDTKIDALTLYVSMLFEWQGWDHPNRDQLPMQSDWRGQYFHLHKPDKWDQAPLLRIDYLELRTKLGLESDQSYISSAALSRTLIDDVAAGRKIPFPAWGDQLARKDDKGQPLTALEKKALELANRLWSYQNHRMGRALEILPVPGSDVREWRPLAHLILTRFNSTNDPTGKYREIQKILERTRAAYREDQPEAFNHCADELKAALRGLGTELGDYPTAFNMSLETAYNHWAPFRFAWILLLTAAVAMLLHLGTNRRLFYVGGLATYGAGLIAIATGFAMRIVISGRPPVTNMYESVVYVGFGTALIGLIFELIYRAKYILTAAAAVCTIALILADNSPTILDPSVRPLEPVLRSNFWLVTHVMTIALSYAAFALALGIANITLGYYLFRSSNRTAIAALSRFTYKAIQVGVLLLAAGVILGGVWADYSWGRFWGWDPKEVWALVALLGYLCVLHARFIGWVGHRGLAALSIGCFSLVVMAWYGVNFVLGAGLHSYGFGGGGRAWVYTAVALEWLYAGAALRRSRPDVPKYKHEAPGEREAGRLGEAQAVQAVHEEWAAGTW
jgi:cytochrome c-type biogenesis protein CcsB